MQKFPEDTTEPEELKEPFRSEKETDVNLSGSYGGKSAEYTETVMFESLISWSKKKNLFRSVFL